MNEDDNNEIGVTLIQLCEYEVGQPGVEDFASAASGAWDVIGNSEGRHVSRAVVKGGEA